MTPRRAVAADLRRLSLTATLAFVVDLTGGDEARDLGEHLGMHRSYVAELQSAFGVLTPIAGAIASQLIQTAG